ncbi:DUF7352 domain-containing protein [Roseibium sp. Sym1]|uniref:DUF7352 domain-containing protein n=1 Tax=Roseibium sp. Sym1 TaxID=3016006 RepID=UPI0022B343D2|nr:hypothetical protein [Roseibium sp. Sym1]
METIWKFTISPTDEVSIQMPEGATVLSAGVQGETMCLWAQVNPEKKTVVRRFYVVGTGHLMPIGSLRFIDTVQMMNGALVFHIFEAC